MPVFGTAEPAHLSSLASSRFQSHIAIMTPKAILDEIMRLPLAERLKLVEDVWDSIAATAGAVPVPDWHIAELDRRLDHPSKEPSMSWDEVRSRLHKSG